MGLLDTVKSKIANNKNKPQAIQGKRSSTVDGAARKASGASSTPAGKDSKRS